MATTSFSQTKIEGTFSAQDSWNWYSMTFYSDSLFTNSTWSCGGGGVSKGVYKIINKTLVLKYISNDTLKTYSKEKINCDSLHKNHFNKTQFSYKKNDVWIYKIKKNTSKKIILSDGKYSYPLDRTAN